MKIMINGQEMFPTRYASAQDLNGKAYTLQIESIRQETMTNRRTKQEQEKFVIYFKGAKRGFVLGKEFAESIAAACNNSNANEWIGRHIEIYVVKTNLGPGVRARPASPAVQPEALPLDDEAEEEIVSA